MPNKRIKFHANKDIQTLLTTTKDINNWIITQHQQYQPHLNIPPIPHTKHKNIKKTLNNQAHNALKNTPGTTYTQKLMNLYYNQQKRQQKTQNRKQILQTLFPKNNHNKKKDDDTTNK